MSDKQPPDIALIAPAEPRPKRKNWLMRTLLVVGSLSIALYVFVRLDRSVAERLGPVGEGVHDLFNQVPGKPTPFTAAAKQLAADVEAMGGHPGINITKPGVFGTIGQVEWFNVTFHNAEFDDAALARLAEAHGHQIGGLSLENTSVTDAGLKSLAKFTMLKHLTIRHFPLRLKPGETRPPSPITDTGLVHLKGLDHLQTLNLMDLPITDDGLESISELPELIALYLARTKVQGNGFARMKSLSRFSILYLDGTPLAEDSLKALSGATSLQYLSLNQVHLTPEALPLLRAIPRLDHLELTGCGFLDEEVDALVKSKPGLKIMRR